MLRQVWFSNNTQQQNDNWPSLVVSLEQTNSSNTLWPPQPVLVIEWDASQLGWGAQCVKASMGGWWPVSNPSHQLTGITGGLSISPNLRKHPKGPDSPENGQYLSSNIHKSKGRHSLNPTVQSSLGNLGMVPPKAINNPSRTSPVLGSLNLVVNSESRRIKDQCSWMINPKNFQQIQQSLDHYKQICSRLAWQNSYPTTTAGGWIQKQKRRILLTKTGPNQGDSQIPCGVWFLGVWTK